jgi:hypothetical protein
MRNNVKKCKKVNPDTPKWIPTLGIRSFEMSRNFETRFGESNLIQN